ncbi:hypothetical protein D0860_04960 [Hortaea werneckii]|uniref:F-box domain-containing protein n=1 Tax=Hortaea werneckii TaxID=91943 RepID=A0A3M7H399_HORWE|nr:hypothetical protein D0860_04960 [Hortaea werneckii]
MQNLDTTPRDIQHCILQFITDPRDLYNLMLTCKELREAALPFYYNTFHVYGNVALSVLAAALVPTNPGLQHVRHLVIKEPYVHTPIDCQRDPTLSKTDTTLTLLANLLPCGCLLTFTYDCVVSLPSSTLAILYRRQSKLRTLRLDSIDLEPLIALRSPDSLANIATVRICTSDPGQASSWNHVLPNLPSLRNLEVTASPCQCAEYPLTAKASSDVFAKLLDWTWQESQYELHLHTLQVQGFDLTGASGILRRQVDFPGLQVLGMQLCANSVCLVKILYETRELGRLNLRTLILVEAEKDPESLEENPALGRLLGTFDTLEHLFVRAQGNMAYWPDFSAIAKHAASLRLLHLNCPMPKLHDPQRVEVSLRQLDECATAYRYRDMRNLLAALETLPRLRTVQILDMLLYDLQVGSNDRDLLKCFVRRQTRVLAEYAFNLMANLKVFGFERFKYRRSRNNTWLPCKGQTYHRGRTIDARGREQTTAIDASLQELKQIEPAVEVLDMQGLEHGGLFRFGYDL